MRERVSVELTDTQLSYLSPPHQIEGLLLRYSRRALAKLPDEQRSLIILIGLEGKRYPTVASLFGLPLGTVRSRLSRGRRAYFPTISLNRPFWHL
jgi:DNA-directed RNA polymerase specialized sigma24 family protein